LSSPDTLDTARLHLRRITPSDVPAMHEIFSDPEVMRFWSRLPHSTLAESETWVAKNVAAVADGTADDFAVLHEGVLIGRVGIWQKNELGLIFARHAWGNGFAREALEALIERQRKRGLEEIMADIDPRNIRVAKLLEKLGFRKTGEAKGTYRIGDIWTDSHYLTLKLGDY
jgi:RimJ/RimL family protein N-acetyltransferase